MSQLCAIARTAGSAIGESGIVKIAKHWGLTELILQATLLSEQFDAFASALAKAIVTLEERSK